MVTTKAKTQKTKPENRNNNHQTQKIPQNSYENNVNQFNQSAMHLPYDAKYKFFKNEVRF